MSRSKHQREKAKQRRELEAKYDGILSDTKLKKQTEHRQKKQKRKDVEQISSMIKLDGYKDFAVREMDSWKSKSHNVQRQRDDFIRHLFVRYPVPSFMYKAFYPIESKPRTFRVAAIQGTEDRDYRRWFIALAQGESFPKLVKEVMTKKEAFVFLQSDNFRTIRMSVWWAKMTVAGLQHKWVRRLLDKFFDINRSNLSPEKGKELVNFFTRFQGDLDDQTFDEITDYLANQFANVPGFSLKGRTLSSVIRLSNEWHMMIHKAKVDKYVEWPGINVEDWQHKYKGEDTTWTIKQLKNNIDLVNEGRKQRHCVYSYVRSCQSGQCSIFTMDSEDEVGNKTKHITIEVRWGKIVQARGRMNRQPTNRERQVMNLWALKNLP